MFIFGTCKWKDLLVDRVEMKYKHVITKAHLIWRLNFEQVSFFGFLFCFSNAIVFTYDIMTIETKRKLFALIYTGSDLLDLYAISIIIL